MVRTRAIATCETTSALRAPAPARPAVAPFTPSRSHATRDSRPGRGDAAAVIASASAMASSAARPTEVSFTAACSIWLNGAFGAGKTTVAHALAAELPDALVLDPEQIGRMLRRVVPAALRTSDFQDIPSWRRLTVATIESLLRDHPGPLIVPMTVVNPVYFDETVGRLATVRHHRPSLRSRRLSEDHPPPAPGPPLPAVGDLVGSSPRRALLLRVAVTVVRRPHRHRETVRARHRGDHQAMC